MWKQEGRVSLWRYTANGRNYPGWHLNADKVGCASFLALLQELAGSPGNHRTVQLSAPGRAQLAVPNNQRGEAPSVAPQKLRISCSTEPEIWVFPPDLEPAYLMFGAHWLEPLCRGVAGIPDGRGDFSVGSSRDGNLPLWFWW